MDHSDTLPPDGIPQDVMEAAHAMCARHYMTHSDDTALVVARAIMAERERCAGICDQHLVGLVNRDTSFTARSIAAAIRGGQS